MPHSRAEGLQNGTIAVGDQGPQEALGLAQ